MSTWTDIVSVAVHDRHAVGLKSDSTCVATGWNKYKPCDVEEWTDVIAVNAYGLQTVCLRSDGTVYAHTWGANSADKWTDIIAIYSIGFHMAGLRSDGTLVTWDNRGMPYNQYSVSDWSDIKLPEGL